MKNPLISIIIPMFNAQNYAEKCLECIEKQTYENIEIIIIDDGSIDNTYKICRKSAIKDFRIRLFHVKNGGVSKARNYGIRVANGKYITFIDADDYVFPTYVEYLYKLLNKYSADVSVCSYIKLHEDERINIKYEKKNKVIFYHQREALCDLLYRKNLSSYAVLKLIKADIVKKVNFDEEVAYGEDFLFSYNLIKKSKKIIYGSKVLYIYIQCKNSVTHNINLEKYLKSLKILFKHILEDVGNDTYLQNAVNAKLFITALGASCNLFKYNTKYEYTKKIIASNRKSVLLNKQCKISNRILAFMCFINIDITIKICVFYSCFKGLLKFETRRTL